MKKIISFTALILLLSFSPADQPLKVEADIPTWNKHLLKVDNIKRSLQVKYSMNERCMTEKEMEYIYNSLDSLQMLVVDQLKKQLTDTSKRK